MRELQTHRRKELPRVRQGPARACQGHAPTRQHRTQARQVPVSSSKRVAEPATLPEWIPQHRPGSDLPSYCDPVAGADVRLLAVAFVFLPQKSGSCLTHSGSG